MQMGKEYAKTMHRQCSGIAKRQSKDLQRLNQIWV